MKHYPLVSVIVPSYNSGNLIRTSVESIVGQTYKNWELIIIDDGSNDATQLVCQQFDDERIRIITNSKQMGIPKTLNRGLSESKGKYIARLDSDDIAAPERLQRQVEFLEANPDYGMVGSWMKVFGDSEFIAKYPLEDSTIRFEMLFCNPFGHPSVMFRRDWDNGELGLYDEEFTSAQDYDLWERISQIWLCANLEECLTHYRLHANQKSNGNASERHKFEKQVIARQFARLGIIPLAASASLLEACRWWHIFANHPLIRQKFRSQEITKMKSKHLRRAIRSHIDSVLPPR